MKKGTCNSPLLRFSDPEGPKIKNSNARKSPAGPASGKNKRNQGYLGLEKQTELKQAICKHAVEQHLRKGDQSPRHTELVKLTVRPSWEAGKRQAQAQRAGAGGRHSDYSRHNRGTSQSLPGKWEPEPWLQRSRILTTKA